MRMKAFKPVAAECIFDCKENLLKIRLGFKRALIPRVQMTEINAGYQPFVHLAQLQNLIKRAQLIHLAHGFGADMNV